MTPCLHSEAYTLHMIKAAATAAAQPHATWVQIMLDLGMGSLTLVSTFGLLGGLTVVVAGPLVGDWIDRHVPFRPSCAQNLPILPCMVHCSLQALLNLQD